MPAHRLLITIAAVLAAGFIGVTGAAELARLPYSAHGLTLNTLHSDASGASLQALAGDLPALAEDEGSATGIQDRPFSSGLLWALPGTATAVEVEVSDLQWRDLQPGEIPDSVRAAVLAEPRPLAQASGVMSMRGVKLTTVAINALQPAPDGQSLRVCEAMQVNLNYVLGGVAPDPRYLSAEIVESARGVVANLDDVVPAPARRPDPYLIITRPAYQTTALANFVDWKRRRGHTVTVVNTDVAGTTNQDIKNYIQDAYDDWAEPPLYVLLIGDVETGANQLPTWIMQGFYRPTNVTDHPYALLEGDDYLPDILVGRISVDTPGDLNTILTKCIRYETIPFEPEGAWRRRMLICGVRSSPGWYETYNSAWPTLRWIGRQFIEHGYSTIDSVTYPGGAASQISARINAGQSFVAYRGFGAPESWSMPYWSSADIMALTNGERLPFVTSIVCGGGAFDNANGADPCFGEVWLRAGTASNPKGAIGFIGPSELDTKTRWNNTNVAGIYEGILFENIQTLSTAMLRGKLELLLQFPNNANIHGNDANRSVSFYFNTYNLLGDPGLTFFVGDVRDLTAAVPDTVVQGTPSLVLSVTEGVTPLADAWGTVSVADTIFSRAISDADGYLSLALPQSGAAAALITLSKPRHEPRTDTVVIAPAAAAVAAGSVRILDGGSHGSSGNADGFMNPGERIALGVVLHNFGTAAYGGGTVTLTTTDPELLIVNGQAVAGAIAPGANSDSLFFTFDVAASCPDGHQARLSWDIGTGGEPWESTLPVLAPQISVQLVRTNGTEGNPPPGQSSSVTLVLLNSGSGALPAGSLRLRSFDARLVLTDSVATYPAILPGATAEPTDNGFTLSPNGFYPGDWAYAELIVTTTGASFAFDYRLPIGTIAEGGPTPPDEYGYRAFQSSDTAWPEAPTYAWMEIDPTQGGPGVVVPVPDIDEGHDTTAVTPLPFPFTFYGQSYNQISICSNGFVSFGPTRESFFRNYSLPAIASPDNMVAVFWDDLINTGISRICKYHDVDGGRFIIEWSRVQNQFQPSMRESFQIVLYDTACWATRTGDGDLLLQYNEFNNVDSWDNYATIGIQNRDLGYALQVSYANIYGPGSSIIRSGESVLFTTGRPQNIPFLGFAGTQVDDDSSGGSFGNSDGVAQSGETVQLQFRLQNTGTTPTSAATGRLRTMDPLLTVLDTAVTLPSIPGGQIGSTNALRVQISPTTPHDHVGTFTLLLDGDVSPCVILPSVVIAAPALTALPMVVDDDTTGPSDGNGNGEFNSGETIELVPGARNDGGGPATGVTARLQRMDSRLVVLDSTAALPDIAPDSQRTATDGFLIRLNNNIPDGQQTQLRVILTNAAGSTWTQVFQYLITQPALRWAGFRIADPYPGGDGDGRLILGEAGGLFPSVQNTGLGTATNVVVTVTSLDSLLTLENAVVQLGTVSGGTTREAETPVQVTVADSGREPRLARLTVLITASGGILVSDTATIIIGDVAYFDDMEGNRSDWTIFGTPGLWHRQGREYTSPSLSYYCGRESSQDYPAWADAYLRSPAFVLPQGSTLSLMSRHELDTTDAGDFCRIQVQLGSSSYYTMEHLTGSSGGWVERTYSLDALPPATQARIRLWFYSNGTGANGGWYVDDVVIIDPESRVDEDPPALPPSQFALNPNFPNPFNDRTTISYSVPHTAPVRLTLCDVNGRRVATLVDGRREPGTYRVSWQPLAMASGVYFIRLEAPGVQMVRKALYLK